MGIGRREFLNLFGASIATLAIDPSDAIAIYDNQYVNRKLGIAFQKPKGWHFANVQEMGEVRDGQILDLGDNELLQEIFGSMNLPILTLSQEPISAESDHFAPGITIYLERLFEEGANDTTECISPMEILEADSELCQTVLKDFKVTSPFKSMQISACAAGEYTASFLFEHENLAPTPVRARTLIVDQDQQIYTIRMFDSPYVDGDMTFDYTPFVESIKMV